MHHCASCTRTHRLLPLFCSLPDFPSAVSAHLAWRRVRRSVRHGGVVDVAGHGLWSLARSPLVAVVLRAHALRVRRGG
jgi:hypothetical protein